MSGVVARIEDEVGKFYDRLGRCESTSAKLIEARRGWRKFEVLQTFVALDAQE